MAKKQVEAETVENDEMPSMISYGESLADAEAPEPLPASRYPAVIESAEIKTSQRTGNDYVSVGFRISTDDFPADFDINNAPEGVLLSYNRLSPADNIQARFRMRKFVEAIGAEMGSALNLNDWIGLSTSIELTVSEYEGIPRNEIKSVHGG